MLGLLNSKTTAAIACVILFSASTLASTANVITETSVRNILSQLDHAVHTHNTDALMALLSPRFYITTSVNNQSESLSRAQYQRAFDAVSTEGIKTDTRDVSITIATGAQSATVTLLRTIYNTHDQKAHSAQSKETILMTLEGGELLITTIEANF